MAEGSRRYQNRWNSPTDAKQPPGLNLVWHNALQILSFSADPTAVPAMPDVHSIFSCSSQL